MSDEECADTGVEIVADLNKAIADSLERHNDPALAILPEGPYVVPKYANARAA